MAERYILDRTVNFHKWYNSVYSENIRNNGYFIHGVVLSIKLIGSNTKYFIYLNLTKMLAKY